MDIAAIADNHQRLMDELCRRLERGIELEMSHRFMCVEGLPMAISQTGEEYIAITSAGIVSEGEPHKPHCFPAPPEVVAISLAMHISSYARDKSGCLYWRIRPEILKRENRGYDAYCRLLISDAPVKWRTAGEYERSLDA